MLVREVRMTSQFGHVMTPGSLLMEVIRFVSEEIRICASLARGQLRDDALVSMSYASKAELLPVKYPSSEGAWLLRQ